MSGQYVLNILTRVTTEHEKQSPSNVNECQVPLSFVKTAKLSAKHDRKHGLAHCANGPKYFNKTRNIQQCNMFICFAQIKHAKVPFYSSTQTKNLTTQANHIVTTE